MYFETEGVIIRWI